MFSKHREWAKDMYIHNSSHAHCTILFYLQCYHIVQLICTSINSKEYKMQVASLEICYWLILAPYFSPYKSVMPNSIFKQAKTVLTKVKSLTCWICFRCITIAAPITHQYQCQRVLSTFFFNKWKNILENHLVLRTRNYTEFYTAWQKHFTWHVTAKVQWYKCFSHQSWMSVPLHHQVSCAL